MKKSKRRLLAAFLNANPCFFDKMNCLNTLRENFVSIKETLDGMCYGSQDHIMPVFITTLGQRKSAT